jgi:hypothetical protein
MDLVTSVQKRTALDGATVVEAVVHLSPAQAGFGTDAVRSVINGRYRVPELTVDQILTLRELTALGDGLDDLRHAEGTSVLVLSVARLGLLRDALAESDLLAAAALADTLGDVYAEAVRAALDAPSAEPALS